MLIWLFIRASATDVVRLPALGAGSDQKSHRKRPAPILSKLRSIPSDTATRRRRVTRIRAHRGRACETGRNHGPYDCLAWRERWRLAASVIGAPRPVLYRPACRLRDISSHARRPRQWCQKFVSLASRRKSLDVPIARFSPLLNHFCDCAWCRPGLRDRCRCSTRRRFRRPAIRSGKVRCIRGSACRRRWSTTRKADHQSRKLRGTLDQRAAHENRADHGSVVIGFDVLEA